MTFRAIFTALATGSLFATGTLCAWENPDYTAQSLTKLEVYPATIQLDIHSCSSTTSEVFLLHEGSYSSVAADEQEWISSPATNVMMRFTPDCMLAVQIEANPESYRELPED